MNPTAARLTLDINANLDTSEDWKYLNLIGTAPAGTATNRVLFHFTTDSTIENSSQSSALIDNVSLTAGILGGSVATADWTSFADATHAAAAQYSGLYAIGNTNIVITDINEQTVGTTSVSSINGMAFTASGRQLFISTPTSVQAFNVGTGAQRDFVTGLSLGSGKTGIAHFKGELFVGTTSGEIRRYDAQLDDATGSYNNSINFTGSDTGEPVRGIAVDIQDEMLYVASPSNLYSLNPSNSVMTQITSLSGIEAISFGRTYGSNGQGGLVILQETGAKRYLHLVPTADLQAGGAVTPNPYYETSSSLPDLGMTACGRILAAGTSPCMLSDTNDTRMGFMDWVADEFQQNVLAAKSLCWQDSGNLTGMVNNTVKKLGSNRGVVGSPDAAYWVVNQLLMSDEINGDTEAQDMVREIIKRYATLEVNSDGQWYHWYNVDTGDLHTWEFPDPETSAYSTMKAVHMAIRAKKYYPGDTEIVDAANTIIVREFGSFASPADNQGPVIGGHRPKPYQELHLYSELMAATEPMNENAYLDYWRYRDNHPYDYELPDEPIVKTAMAGFWRMYDQATIAHCRESSEWKQEFKNFYALFAGWTDDNTPEHLTAFSAGSTPSGYSSDKYNNHPDTVNSFGTVMGFGLHGDTVPVVGAYFAYRDGRRQDMEGSASYAGASMLTRISYEQPSWLLASISPTDHQYGSYALGELLSPGSIDRTIANPTYLEPQWSVQTNGDYLVEFSQLVKRQVWGTADGSNWDFLGFQLTPYSVPSSLGYTNFAVVGAEGELLVPDTTTSTNHEYDVTDDFDSTLYIVRAVSTNTTNLRVQWFNGASFISEQTNSTLRVDAVKPTGATTMKVDLYGNDFDQISVELDGKPELFSNHGFEDGNFNGWSSTQQAGLSRVNVADTRLEGSRACEFVATVGAVNGNYTQVYHEYDISGDPTNTHYVLEYDVLSENLEGSSLSTRVKFYDGGSSQIRDDYFDSYENAHSQTRLSAGIRKRDNDHETLRFIIRLTRNDASAVTADEHVLVDNLRLLKMQP